MEESCFYQSVKCVLIKDQNLLKRIKPAGY